MYKAESTGGSSKAPGYYQSEGQESLGYGGDGPTGGGPSHVPANYQSEGKVDRYYGLGYKGGSAMAPPPGYGTGSTPDASQGNLEQLIKICKCSCSQC